ncbi:MAG: hypothetical protein QXQ70_07820 [Candidatus Caldarchaeum sp.]
MAYKVAVVGATGAVGNQMLEILHETEFPVDEVYAVASARSVGKEVSFGDDVRPSLSNYRVQWMILRRAVDSKPSNLLFYAPFCEFDGGSWMFTHVSDFVGLGSTPCIPAVTCMNQENIVRPDLKPSFFSGSFHHLARVDIVIAHISANVYDHALTYEVIDVYTSNVFSTSHEMELPVEVCTSMQRPLDIHGVDIVFAEPFYPRPFKGRIPHEWRCFCTGWLGEVVNFYFR